MSESKQSYHYMTRTFFRAGTYKVWLGLTWLWSLNITLIWNSGYIQKKHNKVIRFEKVHGLVNITGEKLFHWQWYYLKKKLYSLWIFHMDINAVDFAIKPFCSGFWCFKVILFSLSLDTISVLCGVTVIVIVMQWRMCKHFGHYKGHKFLLFA